MKMDIAVIVIFALTMFLSMRRGFLYTVAGFFKGIASIVVAYLFCGTVGSWIEVTSVGEATELRITEALSTKWEDSQLYMALPDILKDNSDEISSGVIANSAHEINHYAWMIFSFIIIVVVIRIVCGILMDALKKSREKEGFAGTLDWLLGLIMGIIIGIFVVFLCLALLFPVASLVAPGHAEDIMAWFDGSFFAQDLYDNNILFLLFSSLFK